MSELAEIIDLLTLDAELLKKGRERQSAVWKDTEPDYLPLLLSDAEVPELANLKHYTLKEQFYDKEKMLFENLKGLLGTAKAKSDAQLSMRANLGVGLVPTVFGLKPIFPQDDQMPWFVRTDPFGKSRLSKEEILNLKVDAGIKKMGLIPQALEYMDYFKTRLKDGIHLYCYDTQGPFDLAHLLRGSEIYTDVYDDPEFVHRLMSITTDLFIESVKIYKEVISEPYDSGYHSISLFMDGGGVRLCDDSSINLSPPLFKEFSLPYIKKALVPFGGGWVHFCGNANHLLDMYLEVDEIKGINFGNPEKYDYEKVMSGILARGKFYFGGWPRNKGETLENYFRRILCPLKGKKCGLILQMSRGKGQESCAQILDLWHSLQEAK